MTRVLCYGGTVVDKRPIFQPIIMWVAVILFALLRVSPEKTEQPSCVCLCVGSFPQLYQIGESDALLFYSVWAVVIMAQ